MDRVGLQATSAATLTLALTGYVAAMLGALAAFLVTSHPLARGLAGFALAVGGALGLVMRGGGIVRDDFSAKLAEDTDARRRRAAIAAAESAGAAEMAAAEAVAPAPRA
jgi:hypothetical protein